MHDWASNFILSIYLSNVSVHLLHFFCKSHLVSVYLGFYLLIWVYLASLFCFLLLLLFWNRGLTEYHGSTDLHAFYLSSAVSAQTLLHCISSLCCPHTHTHTPHTTSPQWPQPVFTRGLYTNTLIATCCHGTWPERMPERARDPSRDQGLMGGVSSSETSRLIPRVRQWMVQFCFPRKGGRPWINSVQQLTHHTAR